MRLSELLRYFLKEKEEKVTKATIKNYQRKLAPFVYHLKEQDIELDHQVTAQAVSQYAEEMKKLKEKIQGGAHNHLWIVCTFLRWVQAKSGTHFDVKSALSLPKQTRHKKVFLSEEEAELLLSNAQLHPKHEKRDRLIMMLVKVEGLSPKTLNGLTVLDADAIDQEIRIKKKKTFMKIQPKTTSYLIRYLKMRGKYLPKTDALLVNKKGFRMTEQSIRKTIRLVMKGPLK